MRFFSLLPLEKFNLDRVKLDKLDTKKEDEKRRYSLIPETFSNWLQDCELQFGVSLAAARGGVGRGG